MISNYTRENRKPHLIHRAHQDDQYMPRLPVEDRYTVIGEKGQLIVQAAYMHPMEDGSADYGEHTGLDYGEYTGLYVSRRIINKASWEGKTKVLVANYGGNLAGSVVLDSADKSQEDVLYGGMQCSFQYIFLWNERPKIDGLTFSVCSHRPYYKGWGGNKGGDLAMAINFATVDGKHRIGMVVRLYALNKNQHFSERIVGFDPNSGKLHVSEYLGCVDNRYITAAPESDGSKHSRGDKQFIGNPKVFNNFFKFSLSDKKFAALLKDAISPKYFGKYIPVRDWRLTAATMLYELNEDGGAIYGGAHSGFKVQQN